jgi:2-isopropylmalate synthase
MRRIRILDTTLRDGDQAAGFAFSAEEKRALALALAEAGVDIIETGFPRSSPAEFETCRRIALELAGWRPEGPRSAGVPAAGRPLTAVMCRGRMRDIAEAAAVFRGGIPGALHISLPVSKTHIEAKFGKTEKEFLGLAVETVSFAAGLVPVVELGAEDASRADSAFLLDYCAAALDTGAGIINIADTLGVFAPPGIADLVTFLRKGIPSFDAGRAVLSVHCHNDLGLACANTLAAIEAGCGQAEVSVSGVGERAGNAALEELSVNLVTRPGLYRAWTGIRPEKIAPLLTLTAEASGTAGSPMKPLSGWNVRAHSSGIHQQGLSKNSETYAPSLPEWPLLVPERIVLSRHSGRAGAALFARRYCGMELDEALLSRLVPLIKAAPETTTELSEFIRMLISLRALPAAYPGPLLASSFSETFRAGTETGAASTAGDAPRYRMTASLTRYRAPASPGEGLTLTGEGETQAGVIFAAVSAGTGTELRLGRLAINGAGCKLRLYTEICVPGDRLYAIERTGSSIGCLLLDSCLDAVNGTALRNPG